jgi:ribosomal protein L19
MELVRMSNAPIGNESQMEQIRRDMALKEQSDAVSLGDKAKNVVEIDYEAEESGKRYVGKIIFKRPNVMENLKIGGRKSKLLQDAGVEKIELVDEGVYMMAQALATLETVIDKCPEWLIDLASIEDADLLFHVYGKFRAWQYSFRLEGALQSEGNS